MKQKNALQHLLWRAGFGCSPASWIEKQSWSTQRVVDFLFENAAKATDDLRQQTYAQSDQKPPKMLTPQERAEQNKRQRKMVHQHNIDWLLEMAKDEESDLLHKMALFWHGHFACTSKVGVLAKNQLLTLKKYALGNFKDLVVAIAKDPSMIRFLNNQQNRKNSPNENFARELMELFTIGRGHYTEKDVREAARAFTGWSSNLRGEYVFKKRQHDYGSKTFMGQTGNFDGTDIIDIILSKRATAEFICRKIYRYFVHPTVDEKRIQQLTTFFYQSNYEIAPLMRLIFASDWFYESSNHLVKIKSPTEFLVGMMRQLNLTIKNKMALFGIQKALGQTLFNPPNVAGWNEGKSWIDNATLLLRLNLPQAVFYAAEFNRKEKDDMEGKKGGGKLKKLEARAHLQPLVRMLNTSSKEVALEKLSNYLLARTVEEHQFDLRKFTDKKSPESFVKSLTMRLMMLPEYQLC
ncbi:MAG: DUF1800 domain-containing protein [Bacteroidota bacterium]